MASSSQEKITVPMAGIWKDFTGGSDGNRFVPEPHGSKEDKDVWEDQISRPFPPRLMRFFLASRLVNPGSLTAILIILAF
ncbi:hypothetical protein A2U01_0034682 [Trifolium medium]|uniref:Uncharacterized protein n=1 Tax=Trifolium medium TaxID=97028 RepID=A0A392PP19_9FABA|nr:hypothetical protein [Trifolium medium]